MEEKLDYNRQSKILVAIFAAFFVVGVVAAKWALFTSLAIVVVLSSIFGAFMGSYKKWLYLGALR